MRDGAIARQNGPPDWLPSRHNGRESDGLSSARDAVEASLAEAAALIERTGAKILAPALCEWRAELAAVLGDEATRAQLLRQAQQGYEDIGAPATRRGWRSSWNGSRIEPPVPNWTYFPSTDTPTA